MTVHVVDLDSGIFHMRVETVGQLLMRHRMEMTEEEIKKELQETLQDWGYDAQVVLVIRVGASLEVSIRAGERSKQFFINFS
jgi:hypothetical protein